ncbi:MAG: precorrin-3B synthase [Hyphomicrobiaceae bacterium]
MAECPGVYRLSLMRDGGLARIRIPGGCLSSDQMRTIADIAEKFGNGRIDLTNRANLQIRGLDPDNTSPVEAALRASGLLCPDPSADRIRNITASPLAGLDPDEIIDVRPYVAELDAALQASRHAPAMSPKFSFVVDGGGQTCLADVGHDVGFFALGVNGAQRFAVSLAGHATTQTIAPEDIAKLACALIAVANHREYGRMRDLLAHNKPDELISSVARTHDIECIPNTRGNMQPAGIPLGYRDATNKDTSWACLGIPLARLDATQAHILSDFADRAAAKLNLTPWHSVVIPKVSQDAADHICTHAPDHGFDIGEPAVRIIACAGSTGCERTQADTRSDARRLIAAFTANPGTANGTQRTVHLSGCSRGCAHPGPSDILALAIDGSANYQLHAGSRPSDAAGKPPIEDNIRPGDLAETVGHILKS